MLKGCLNHLRALADLLARKPAPRLLVALYLSVRWRCLVSPSTDIHYPLHIVMGRGTMIPGRCTLIASGDGIVIGKGVEIHEGAYLHCQGGRITVGRRSGPMSSCTAAARCGL
jgi:acetyltransferase-like isoleucine patch superfamily enzyme